MNGKFGDPGNYSYIYGIKLNNLKTKDMPNMSYCRFQNTYNDLIDCSVNLFDKDISDNEKMARKNLVELCKEIVERFEFNNFGELEDDWDDEDEE